MNVYVAIGAGLRGMYMPDTVYIDCFTRRRDLKRAVIKQLEYSCPETEIIPSQVKREAARVVAKFWADRHKKPWGEYVVPMGDAYGIFISFSTREDFKKAMDEAL